MDVKIKKRKCYLELSTKDGIQLMIAVKNEQNNSYMVIDFRETNEHIEPTKYLLDTNEMQSIKYEKYEKNISMFDFPIKIRINSSGLKTVKWREMNGVILEGADNADKEFNFNTEAFVWSYESVKSLMNNCKLFWESYEGDLMLAKTKKEYMRPSDSDFW